MENQPSLEPLEGVVPLTESGALKLAADSSGASEETPEEDARIDRLVATDPREEVVDLGKIDDLAKAPEVALPAAAPEENITLPKSKVILLKKIADNLKESSRQLADLLAVFGETDLKIKVGQSAAPLKTDKAEEGKIVEGMFDGEKMIDGEGKTYNVPVNYASKSRLVEGDSLKLIITPDGTFIFKQIKPVERRRLSGILEETDSGEYYVLADDRKWRVLAASVTYFKGEAGDEVVIIVPREGLSKWAAVENIIKR